MQNHSTILDQTTWGIHLNSERHFASPPIPPTWLTQLHQQDWQQRGIVVWDAVLRIVAHLYAGYAIELLEHLQDNTAWKTEGLVIGSPAFQLSANSANTPSTKIGGDWVLKNQIELSADQAQIFIEFLSVREGLLKRISSYDKEDVFYKLKSAQFIIEKVPTVKKERLKLLSKRGPLYYRKVAQFCTVQRAGDKILLAQRRIGQC